MENDKLRLLKILKEKSVSYGNITLSSGTGADSGLRADLASVANGAGASLVGVEDSAGGIPG